MELDISKKEGTEKTVYAGTGISKDNDPYKAGKEAVKMAIDKCGAKPDFGIVFCSGGKYGKNDRTMKKLVKGAHEAFTSVNPDCKWFGCTSAGEISNYGFTSESCVAIAIKSEFIHVGIGVGRNTHNKPKEAGEDAINHALKSIHVDKYVEPYVRYMAEKKLPVSELVKMKPYTVMMLNSGFTTEKRGNEDDIVEGITKVIGHRVQLMILIYKKRMFLKTVTSIENLLYVQ